MKKRYALFFTTVFLGVLFLTISFSKNYSRAQVEFGLDYQTATSMLPWSPSGFSARALPTVVKLEWKPLKIVTHYNVYRKIEGRDYELIGSTENSNYYDYDIIPGTLYVYSVTTVDTYGNESPKLNTMIEVDFRLLASMLPNNAVRLEWKPINLDVKYYNIYRKKSSRWPKINNLIFKNDVFKKIGSTEKTSFIDDQVKKGQNYSYTVTCVDLYGNEKSSVWGVTELNRFDWLRIAGVIGILLILFILIWWYKKIRNKKCEIKKKEKHN